MCNALMDIEPVVLDLESTIRIMTHLAAGDVETVSQDDWYKLANDLRRGVREITRLWTAALEEQKAKAEEHKAALAAVKAEKEAPGSKADLERADALWIMLRSLVGYAREQCTRAGYPPRPLPTMAELGFREDGPI
jgi:hypothetical protein